MHHAPYEECREIERTHICAECGGGLVTVWEGKAESYAVRCSEGWYHSGLGRVIGYREARQIGLPLPLEVEQQFQREEAREMLDDKERGSRALPALLPTADSANDRQLSGVQVQLMIDYAGMLGLNAYLGHVDIYQGRPRVTIYGRYFHARRQDEYRRVQTRPLTCNERTDQKLEDEMHAWKAEVIDNCEHVIGEGFGYSRDAEGEQLMKGVSERWATPQRRAEKRAEEDALSKAFPIGVCELEDRLSIEKGGDRQ